MFIFTLPFHLTLYRSLHQRVWLPDRRVHTLSTLAGMEEDSVKAMLVASVCCQTAVDNVRLYSPTLSYF